MRSALLDPLVVDELWRAGDSELRQSLSELARLRSAVDAAMLDVIRELDSRSCGSATEAVVRESTAASPAAARRDVAAARVTGADGVLSGFGERLADGTVTREHVDVAVRVLEQVPVSVRQRPGSDRVITGFLLDAVDGGAGPRALRVAGAQLLARLDPDGDCRGFDPDADQRRFLHMHTDATGMVVGRFALDAVAGATLRVAINAHSMPEPERADADGTVIRDQRSTAQRRADALATISDAVLGISSLRRGERPRIVVHTTPAQLAHLAGAGQAVVEGGDPVPGPVLDRMSCDAVLERLVADPSAGPLNVGRDHRLVTVVQRRALEARDQGCVVCGADPSWCDAHHVVPWAAGGASDLENYALLCPRHHTAVHTGRWQIDNRPGGIHLIPPKDVDPRRTPRRPVNHALSALVHALQPDASSG